VTVEYWAADEGENEIWIAPANIPEKRYFLDTYCLGAKVFFSPDETWAALNREEGAAEEDVQLFERRKDGRYTKVENARLFDRCVEFIRETSRLPKSASFNRRYVSVLAWSNDSRSLLLSVYGENASTLEGLEKSFCVLDPKTLKLSLNLGIMNRNNYYPSERVRLRQWKKEKN
jgi:hypothetical protein